jgi:hypothetical protein
MLTASGGSAVVIAVWRREQHHVEALSLELLVFALSFLL